MIDARRIYDFFVSSFYLIKRQMIVECRPTERTQLGIEKKLIGKLFTGTTSLNTSPDSLS